MSKAEESYRTTDLYLASYLHASGTKFTGIERQEGSTKVAFIFRDPEKCRELVNEYFTGDPQCNIRRYVGSLRELKDLIFNPSE